MTARVAGTFFENTPGSFDPAKHEIRKGRQCRRHVPVPLSACSKEICDESESRSNRESGSPIPDVRHARRRSVNGGSRIAWGAGNLGPRHPGRQPRAIRPSGVIHRPEPLHVSGMLEVRGLSSRSRATASCGGLFLRSHFSITVILRPGHFVLPQGSPPFCGSRLYRAILLSS